MVSWRVVVEVVGMEKGGCRGGCQGGWRRWGVRDGDLIIDHGSSCSSLLLFPRYHQVCDVINNYFVCFFEFSCKISSSDIRSFLEFVTPFCIIPINVWNVGNKLVFVGNDIFEQFVLYILQIGESLLFLGQMFICSMWLVVEG